MYIYIFIARVGPRSMHRGSHRPSPSRLRRSSSRGCTHELRRHSRPNLISQNVSIKWFQKVHSPAKSSTVFKK